jgi:hypothetical protein
MAQSAELTQPQRGLKMRRTLLGTVPVDSPLYKLHPVNTFN